MASVYFVNERKTLDALPGTNLRDIALRAGIPLSKPFRRMFPTRLKLGPLQIFSAADVVEVEGKGVLGQSERELKVLEGRLLTRYKVTPNLRVASQVTVMDGDVSVRTLVARHPDKQLTRERIGYLAVVGIFAVLMITMLALVGLDLVKDV